MGAVAVGATIYFGSDESTRQILEVSRGVRAGPRAGPGHRPLVLPAQHGVQDRRQGLPHRRPTSPARPTTWASRSRPTSSSRSCPRTTAASTPSPRRAYGKIDKRVYTRAHARRPPDRPDALPGRQLLHGPHAALINSGGASGENDLAEAVRTAVINKRAGGMGLISGRKAFQRPMEEGVKLLQRSRTSTSDSSITLA